MDYTRTIKFGDTITQQDDGSWTAEFTLDVTWSEFMPLSVEDAEALIDADIDSDPVLTKCVDDAKLDGSKDTLSRCLDKLRTLYNDTSPEAANWKTKRNCTYTAPAAE